MSVLVLQITCSYMKENVHGQDLKLGINFFGSCWILIRQSQMCLRDLCILNHFKGKYFKQVRLLKKNQILTFENRDCEEDKTAENKEDKTISSWSVGFCCCLSLLRNSLGIDGPYSVGEASALCSSCGMCTHHVAQPLWACWYQSCSSRSL